MGGDAPKVYAAVLDCSNVALHVHALTLRDRSRSSLLDKGGASSHIPQQTSPG